MDLALRGGAPLLVVRLLSATLLLLAAGQSVPAAKPTDATSNRAAREEAMRAIPWRQIAPHDRRRVQAVIKSAGIYRRLPTRVIDCDPDIFTFLARHPEVMVDLWRVMGVSDVALDRLPDGVYRGSDGAGTTGTVRYVVADWGRDAHNVAVVLAEGAYEGKPFATPLKAQTVMLFQSGSVQETNGRHYVTVRIDTFVNIEQMGVELVARTVQPWLNRIADQNYIETLTFVSNFSRTAETNPQGMQRLAARLSGVDERTRNELVRLCYQTADRYAQLENASRTGAALLAGPAEPTALNVR